MPVKELYYTGTKEELENLYKWYGGAYVLFMDDIQLHFLGTEKHDRRRSTVFFDSSNGGSYGSSGSFDSEQPEFTVKDTNKLTADKAETLGNLTRIAFNNGISGGKYVLLAVKSSTASPITDRKNLLYIDQQTADENGTAVFEFENLPDDTIYIIAGETADGEFFRYVGTPDLADSNVEGDVNLDGVFSVADLVTLQRWLLSAGKLPYWQHGDLCNDGVIDVFDLVMMRRKIIA